MLVGRTHVELIVGADGIVERCRAGTGEGQRTRGGGVDDEHALGRARHVGVFGTRETGTLTLGVGCSRSHKQQSRKD